MQSDTIYHIIRPDGLPDRITRQSFNSYAEAYDVLETYYQDICCSDERVVYHIVARPGDGG
jgi:hypothetical protein